LIFLLTNLQAWYIVLVNCVAAVVHTRKGPRLWGTAIRNYWKHIDKYTWGLMALCAKHTVAPFEPTMWV